VVVLRNITSYYSCLPSRLFFECFMGQLKQTRPVRRKTMLFNQNESSPRSEWNDPVIHVYGLLGGHYEAPELRFRRAVGYDAAN